MSESKLYKRGLYVIIQAVMANTSSAKKAVRQSDKKRQHNLFWKKRVKNALKAVKELVASKAEKSQIDAEIKMLQKVLDKASKEKAIHKNKANRLKSKYALKIAGISKEIKSSESTGKDSGAKSRKPKSTKSKS